MLALHAMIMNFLMRKAATMLSTPDWEGYPMSVVSSSIWEPGEAGVALLALRPEGRVDDLAVELDVQGGDGIGGAHFEGVGHLCSPVVVVDDVVAVGGGNG
jgi:hypothetical protein